jgi:hypothetical protein
MSVLEVLQTCPTQQKSLLSTLGEVDPTDTRLITFDLDSGEPRLPALVAFQIPVKIQNIRFIGVSLMKVHPHASCPKLYGRNLAPLS